MERIQFSKESEIKLLLQWAGNINLDFSAILLDYSGFLKSREDFVFYNSYKRFPPFEESLYHTKSNWICQSNPISFDESVQLILNSEEFEKEDDLCAEILTIDLKKVRSEIKRIALIASIYDDVLTLNRASRFSLSIRDKNSNSLLFYLVINADDYISQNAIIIGTIVRNSEDNWYFRNTNIAITGGLKSIIDKFSK